jgi:septal ring-binding cell division protein DamX
MEERGLRDVERWRDKIEVRLDNRQVFFLFFGSALVACMLFVLGVIVGKRLESRGRAVSPEIEDPLALLDKVATSPRPAQGGTSLPQALFGTNGKTSAEKPSKKGAVPAPAVAESSAEPAKPAPAAAKASEPAAKTPIEAKPAPAKGEAKPAAAPAAAKQPEAPEAKLAAAAPKPAASKPAEPKETKPAPIPTIAASGESKGKARFALQLSSFQDKAEAEAFAQKFVGERPYMVMSDIPGKGIWYRVRVGDYASAKDALAAKEAFEKKHSVIAYVAQK